MVKLHIKKKVVVRVAILLVLIGVLGALGLWLNALDEQRVKSYGVEATAIGVPKIKEECLKEGLKPGVCNTISSTGDADASECYGDPCWIVYARTKGPEFGASVTLNFRNEHYQVIDYLRNTGLPPQ